MNIRHGQSNPWRKPSFSTTQALALAWIVAVMAVTLTGCTDNTGAANEPKTNIEKAADDAGAKLGDAGNKVGDAIGKAADVAKLTPQVKTAIVANPFLNEDGNLIDVDTDEKHVYLKGHVKTAAMKAEAQKIATKILAENKAKQTVKNELVVK